MSGNVFGEIFRVITFGESHGPYIGLVIDGIKPGMEISIDELQRELDRRRPGQSDLVSPRQEADRAEIISGIFEGKNNRYSPGYSHPKSGSAIAGLSSPASSLAPGACRFYLSAKVWYF